MKNKKSRVLAYYLPQFYPTSDNDKWWGKGFTEWTNVGRSKPLFRGHDQPRVPADLGYYDLRITDVQIEQSEMAMTHGVDAFCYWHYWFGNGRRMLTMPVDRHLNDGRIKISYCLAWANSTWSRTWQGAGEEILIKQVYPGKADYVNHFKAIQNHLIDERYFCVDGKPLFLVYAPDELPSIAEFVEVMQVQARKIGLPGLYLVAYGMKSYQIEKYCNEGFDAVNLWRAFDALAYRSLAKKAIDKLTKLIFNRPTIIDYQEALKYFHSEEEGLDNCIPSITPNWDHSPRTKGRVPILHGSTPSLFKEHVESALNLIKDKPSEKKLVIIKAWNEWAEGNYMEPDTKFGMQYLEVLKKALENDLSTNTG